MKKINSEYIPHHDLPDNLEVKDDFKKIYNLMEYSNQNMFITGKAGSGKTTLLEYFRINSLKNFIILASTGISAIKAKGKTIHSFFLFPPRILINEKIQRLSSKVIGKVDTILIDECSMIRSDILDGIDQSLKLNRRNEDSFGGVQLILLGDLYQLPPVVRSNEEEIFNNFYPNGHFFYNANCYENSQIKTYELEKVYRQKDHVFLDLLNKIRLAEISQDDLFVINRRVISDRSEVPNQTIILSPTNRKVDSINNMNLENIKSDSFFYKSIQTGDFKEKPADELLELKVGAQVMMVKNDLKYPKRWVNGSIGIVHQLDENSIHVKIKKKVYNIPKDNWERFNYSIKDGEVKHEVVATYTQYPIKLAWAVTIHKSQGQTYENVIIDLDSGSFAQGQTYVALSRATTLEGIYLTRAIRVSDIFLNNRFYHSDNYLN